MPSLQGNGYEARSTAPTAGDVRRHHRAELHQSMVALARIGGRGAHGSTSSPRSIRLKTASREQQVLPGLALLARAPEQIGRVIGDEHGPARGPERVDGAAQLRERHVGAEQVLRRDSPDRDDQRRRHEFDLALEVVAAAARLLGARIAVAGRPALEHVGDVDVLPREAEGLQHRRQQLARAADERLALPVLLGAGRLADEHPAGRPAADAEHRLRARRMQFAPRAGRHALAQGAPVQPGSVARRSSALDGAGDGQPDSAPAARAARRRRRPAHRGTPRVAGRSPSAPLLAGSRRGDRARTCARPRTTGPTVRTARTARTASRAGSSRPARTRAAPAAGTRTAAAGSG